MTLGETALILPKGGKWTSNIFPKVSMMSSCKSVEGFHPTNRTSQVVGLALARAVPLQHECHLRILQEADFSDTRYVFTDRGVNQRLCVPA